MGVTLTLLLAEGGLTNELAEAVSLNPIQFWGIPLALVGAHCRLRVPFGAEQEVEDAGLALDGGVEEEAVGLEREARTVFRTYGKRSVGRRPSALRYPTFSSG